MTQPNRKLTNAVLYLLRGCPSRPGVTHLLKMLYYADYWHYRRCLRLITGAEYVALERGPVIDHYKDIFAALEEAKVISRHAVPVEGKADPKIEFSPEVEPDESVFSENELATLDKVITECAHLNGHALSRRTHLEGPWLFAWDPNDVGRKIPPMTFRWLDNLPDDDDLVVAGRHLAAAYPEGIATA